MSQWWVRIKGRVLGPLTARELTERLRTGELQQYHECSADRVTWVSVADVPEFVPADRARPVAVPAGSPRRPRDADDRETDGDGVGVGGYKLVVGILAGVLVVGTAVAVVLLMRGRKSTDGAIVLTDLKETERTRLFEQTVCLVLPGHEVIAGRGDRSEGYMLPVEGDRGIDLIGGTGSGFVVSRAGHVVTNRHVVEGWSRYRHSKAREEYARLTDASRTEPKLWVFFGAKEKFEAELLYSSPDYDFALLKVDRPSPHFFALCDTPEKEIPLLSDLNSLGFPGKDREQVDLKGQLDQAVREVAGKRANFLFPAVERALPDAGFELSKRPATVTKRSEVMRMNATERECYVLRHSGAIFGGNSGGPLVAKDGTVVGINTWAKTAESGISFALTLPQLRDEIARRVPDTVWRRHPE